MTSELELKPCPFCGSSNISAFKDDGGSWQIDCLNICCRINPRTHLCGCKEAAVEAWNTRAGGNK